jgi:hypothetical protein
MSANLSGTALGWSQLYANQPKIAADTAQSWAQLPLLQAQAAETQARVPWTGAQTTKTQLEAEQLRIQNQIKNLALGHMGEGDGGDDSGTTIPRDPNLSPQASGGGAYAPSSAPTITSVETPYPLPPIPPPGGAPPPAAAPAIAPGYSASRGMPPGSVQLAQADTGTMSDVGQQLYTPRPGSLMLASATSEPAPTAPAPRTVVAQATPPGAPPGSAALQGQGAAPQGGGYNPAGVSPHGTNLPGVGPVPKSMAFDYWMAIANGQSPAEARRMISLQRLQRLTELASEAQSPQDWDTRVTMAYREGLLDNNSANQLLGHFGNKDKFVDGLQTAAEQTRAAIDRTQQGLRLTPQGLQVDPTAGAGQENVERGRTKGAGGTQQIIVNDPTSSTGSRTYTVPNWQVDDFIKQHQGATPVGPPTPGPQGSNDTGASTNITRNNLGNLTYAGQPGATRVPGDRFAHFPDVATGVAASATQLAINQDTHGVNSVADQVKQWVHEPGADLKTYIADTAAALGVDPNTKVDWHDPNVQAKFLTAMQPHETGGKGAYLDPADVQRGVQMAAARSGRAQGTQYAGPGVPQPTQAEQNADAIAGGMVGAGAAPDALTAGRPTAGPAVQTAQGGRIGLPGLPAVSAPQIEAATRDRTLIDEDSRTVSGIGTSQLALDQSISSMHDVLNRVDQAITGPGADWRRKLSAVASQFGPGWVQDFAKKLSDGNIDPSKAENSEIVMKQLFLSSQQAESQLLQHGGLGSSQLYSAMFPNPNMLPGSIKEMTNFLTMMQLRTRDWNQGATEHFNKNYDIQPGAIDRTTGAPVRYQPVSKFTQNFNATGSVNAPQVYGGAVAIMDGKSPAVWGRGLSDDQQWAAIQAAKRAGYKFDKTTIPKRFGGTAED